MCASISAEEGGDGWIVRLAGTDGASQVVILPLALDRDGGRVQGTWDHVARTPEGLHAEGDIVHPGGVGRFLLKAVDEPGEGPVRLHWSVEFVVGEHTGAVLYPVLLPGMNLGPEALTLPSIHYGHNTYGTGIFPHPDPRKGFSFRADRLAQPCIQYNTPDATWDYFAGDEAPLQLEPENVYALGVAPESDGAVLFFRYPQLEYGHRGDGGPDAYAAKDMYAPGEDIFLTWQEGTTLEKILYLWCRPPSERLNYAATARYLWRENYAEHSAPATGSLWRQAGDRIRWFNTRLYNSELAGGQFESPEGSGTAMLGFVEQSLCMASTTFMYASLLNNASSGPALSHITGLRRRAADALTRWSTGGCSPEGLLYPVCDSAGFSFGHRDYGDYENLGIVRDESFDTIRLAGEARGLISAARSARYSGTVDNEEVARWEKAAISGADWLIAHPLEGGGYSSRYLRTGQPLDTYPAGTSAALSLFADVAGLLFEQGRREAPGYVQAAIDAYHSTLAGLVRAGLFAGGTLDASVPDREAAISALEACVQLYQLTGDEQYLADARLAADNILSYTMVYAISTFHQETDAGRGISTFGASIVSPENQHLDPVATAPGLLVYGIYAGDDVCIEAGIESLRWALDGRWSIEEVEGVKQSEQLLHTRWFYNNFFTRRGDFRRGMPLWGRSDSEHGWPQVVPASAFLGTGQVMLDWHSGRMVGIDGWAVRSWRKDARGTTIAELTPMNAGSADGEEVLPLFLRVLRLPRTESISIGVGSQAHVLSSSQLGHGHVFTVPASTPVTLEVGLSEAEG